MRACDAVVHPAVGSALYILGAPVTVRALAPAESISHFVSQAIPQSAPFPLTPPPRAFLS